MKILYLNILSILLWINRAVYLGIFFSSILFYDKFFGEFNLLYPVSPILPYLALAGLFSFEAGVFFGNRFSKNRLLQKNRKSFSCFKSSTYFIPFFIWIISLAMSSMLFFIKGIPLFEDPMLRATMGINTGVLKRFMWIFLPVSCIETYCFTLLTKRKYKLTTIIIVITSLIFFLLAFKGKIFFSILAIILIYYKIRMFNYNFSLNLFTINKKYIYFSFLIIFFILTIFIYPRIVPSSYDFANIILLRVTNLIAQSPNYIISNIPAGSDAIDVLKNDLAGVLRTLRLCTSIEPINKDTELTRIILNRDPAYGAGGLNPTVIGYGWMIGGWVGICLLSIFYGFLNIIFFKSFLKTTNPMKIACSIYAIYVLFCAIQIFSPIGTFLDTGLSLLGYIILHRIFEEFFGREASASSRYSRLGCAL